MVWVNYPETKYLQCRYTTWLTDLQIPKIFCSQSKFYSRSLMLMVLYVSVFMRGWTNSLDVEIVGAFLATLLRQFHIFWEGRLKNPIICCEKYPEISVQPHKHKSNTTSSSSSTLHFITLLYAILFNRQNVKTKILTHFDKCLDYVQQQTINEWSSKKTWTDLLNME
jgi:hypothetical protein